MQNKMLDFLSEVQALAEEKGFIIDEFSFDSFPKNETGVPLAPRLEMKIYYKGANK